MAELLTVGKMKLLKVFIARLIILYPWGIASAKTTEPEYSYADFGGGCNVRIEISKKGHLVAKDGHGAMAVFIPKKYDLHAQRRGFLLTCGPDLRGTSLKNNPARFDVETGTWIKDAHEYIYGLNSDMTDVEFQETEKAIRFYPLKAVNANGFMFTIDDSTGEEARRGRYIRFCLARNGIALCGSGNAPVMLLSDGDNADPTIFLKKIIESIEFFDVDK